MWEKYRWGIAYIAGIVLWLVITIGYMLIKSSEYAKGMW